MSLLASARPFGWPPRSELFAMPNRHAMAEFADTVCEMFAVPD